MEQKRTINNKLSWVFTILSIGELAAALAIVAYGLLKGHMSGLTCNVIMGAALGIYWLLGYIFRAVSKKNVYLACAVTGFFSAFLNTVFFMTALVLLFGNTEYVQGLIAGRNIIVFICAFVGVNAVVEMVVATLITGAVGSALFRAKVLSR